MFDTVLQKHIFKNFGRIFAAGVCLIISTDLRAELPAVKFRSVFPELTLDRPVRMEEANDGSGRFFVLEQKGRILVVPKGSDGKQTNEFLNIVDRKPLVFNEEGLLGLAFHPHFRTNGLLYIYYNQQNPRRSVISEFKVSATDSNKADMASERKLMEVEQPFPNHKGGQLTFGPDGFLYIGLGDGGSMNDPHNNAQNTAALLGKVLRIDVNSRTNIINGKHTNSLEYGIPSDNPFANRKYGVRGEIWAYGLRNPWRWSFDRETGELWLADVGQDLWEEVDVIVKGGNYGWNVREAFHPFKPEPEGARYKDPVIEYPHTPTLLSESKFPKQPIGTSITGGYVYRGKKFPALRGVYIYADFTLGSIYGVRAENGKATEYGTLLTQPKNIASFAEDLDGEVYALAFDGKVYAVEPTGANAQSYVPENR
jgi:glucose/arabinose dehydrogenase